MPPTVAECATVDVLRALDPRLLPAIAARCQVRDFAAGETILQRGAANRDLHFVLSGAVEVHVDLAIRTRPIALAAGRMFGEMSVIDDVPVSAFVIAATPCRILLLPEAVFWSEVIGAPGAAREMMRALSQHIRDDTDALLHAMQETIRHEAFARELHLARDIQMGMLRRTASCVPDRDDVAVCAHLQAARLVGGDFYDTFLPDPDHLVLSIGDVAGKGVGAALFMVRALTVLRSAAASGLTLAGTAAAMNRALVQDNEAMMFLTMFLARLDLRSGEVEYVNFGHLPPLIRGPDGRAGFHEMPAGLVLGLREDGAGTAGRLRLAAGSTLVLYTDGVTEAFDAADVPFGAAGLHDAVVAAGGDDPRAVVARIVAAVAAHAGGVEQADDITLLAARFAGPVHG
jgi:sigma-B regulation protein RsbU (phosphoserine phosphatase)